MTAKLELHSNFICWWHLHAVVRSCDHDRSVSFYPNFFSQVLMISINFMDKCEMSGLDIFNYFSYVIFRVWWLVATLIIFLSKPLFLGFSTLEPQFRLLKKWLKIWWCGSFSKWCWHYLFICTGNKCLLQAQTVTLFLFDCFWQFARTLTSRISQDVNLLTLLI